MVPTPPLAPVTVTSVPAGPGAASGAGPQVAPYARRPLGGGLHPGGQLVVAERQPDDAAGAGVHGGGEQRGPGVRGDQDDADGGEAQRHLADQLQRRRRADPLVDEHDLGQLLDGGRRTAAGEAADDAAAPSAAAPASVSSSAAESATGGAGSASGSWLSSVDTARAASGSPTAGRIRMVT